MALYAAKCQALIKVLPRYDNYKIRWKHLVGLQHILYEKEDAEAETKPDLVTACKQPSESKII